MAKTLLDGVNEVLKRTDTLDFNDRLTSLTSDEAKQSWIDIAVQQWNEAVDQIYSETGVPRPMNLAEDVITLQEDLREYFLADDLVRLHWPMIDETNGRYITEHPGGYMGMVNSQINPSSYTGLPLTAAIRPTDGALYLDRSPSVNEDGYAYKYRYDRDTVLEIAQDEFPFTDAVFRAMVPVVAQLWTRQQKGASAFDRAVYTQSYGRACRLLRTEQPRMSYRVTGSKSDASDPYNG